MKNILVLLVFVTGIIVGQDFEKAVKEHNELFAKYTMANDVDAQISLYTEDALSLPSYMPMLKGHKQIKEAAEAGLEMGVKFIEFSLNSEKVLDAGNYVIDIGTYTVTLEMQGMPEESEDYGKYITIFRKMDDGSLKIYADTWNSDINPWEELNDNESDDDDMEYDN